MPKIVFNPLHSDEFQYLNKASDFSGDFVNVSGDTMTGTLDMQDNYILLTSPNGTRYQLSVSNDGALLTEEYVTTGLTGQSMGLGLLFTYP